MADKDFDHGEQVLEDDDYDDYVDEDEIMACIKRGTAKQNLAADKGNALKNVTNASKAKPSTTEQPKKATKKSSPKKPPAAHPAALLTSQVEDYEIYYKLSRASNKQSKAHSGAASDVQGSSLEASAGKDVPKSVCTATNSIDGGKKEAGDQKGQALAKPVDAWADDDPWQTDRGGPSMVCWQHEYPTGEGRDR